MKFIALLFIMVCTSIVSAQQTKSFALNSKTLFFNVDGKQLTFEDFSNITNKYPSTNLIPKFDDKGELEYVTLNYPAEAASLIGKSIIPVSQPNYTTPTVYDNQFSSNAINYDSYSNVNELEGWSAPNFSVLDLNNNKVGTDELFGTVVVIKFWFSKCVPCLEEIPELNRLEAKYRSANVKFLAPSVEKKRLTENFLLTTVFNYTTIYEAQNLAALYKTPGYPTHVVIGKDGKIRKVIVGKRTNIFKILNEEIERALLVQTDDEDVLELDEFEGFVLNDNTVITNEAGERISKEEYTYLLNTGRYKIFKKIKKNGNTNLLITKKN